ncbi:c2h2-type zinc finger transcription factor [Gigaspora margarita]|uniref:C2h2-type zinc finger transcription factor n=1 Tax=Gigaspora margarita TaxID=4874 RepID=A0A8H4AQ51_GIGMA|nr:c2h2-type zinc finger transcription factor [Gigaspora margarita]
MKIEAYLYIAEKHENKEHREKAKRYIDEFDHLSVNSFWLSIYQNNYEERIELEKLRHAESTIRAVNEETEEVRLVSSSETGLLLKRKRQDDMNCSDKGADKRNRCKTLEIKIRTTNGTVVEESSSNSLSDVSSEASLTQPSYTKSQALNEETDSEIKSIDDEISLNSRTNVSSETSLSQQSYKSLESAKEVGDVSASSAIGNNELQDLDTQLETNTSFSEVDLVKFEEAYSKLEPNCMWTLESGRKVEEVIYKFARNLPGETCLHSFIINDAHADVKSLFSDVEWEEITTLEVNENPKLERSLRELMIKYTVNSAKELRKIIYDSFLPDGNEYDKSLHHDLDFINHAYRSMLFLWDREENPFDSSKLEGSRGEGMSYASSDRKNIIRTINDRKKFGRKGDGVFRLHGDRLEFGAIEAKS